MIVEYQIDNEGRVSTSLRSKKAIILAIDTSDKAEAERLAALAKVTGARFIKMGLELSSATSWEYCSKLAKKHGLEWVADAKLDDIPNTVEKTVMNLKKLSYPPFAITMHTSAGLEAMRLAQAAAGDIKMLGVTVLTSMSDKEAKRIYGAAIPQKVLQLASDAVSAGLMGVVASPKEVGIIKRDARTKDLFAMIPGARSLSASTSDQARVGTPAGAIKDGADLLVVGRQITQAKDPAKAYNELLSEIERP
jgi:orotidine-5'-phosphate decarboxylase